jgi:hypothetical protein
MNGNLPGADGRDLGVGGPTLQTQNEVGLKQLSEPMPYLLPMRKNKICILQ